MLYNVLTIIMPLIQSVMETKAYLTLQEVADLLRVDRKTVRAMMDRTPEQDCCWFNVGGDGTRARYRFDAGQINGWLRSVSQ